MRTLPCSIQEDALRLLLQTGNHALLGDNDKAMDWLERAYEDHDPNLPYVPFSPLWYNLSDNPRFQDLCRRMKLSYKKIKY
jgi:uncharacterized UBP type Zn finger protein